ncbi:ADP-ribose pyrophosphatase [Thermoplasmatales archaeon SCGC AB-539-C06]|nr:ADP-ribose pyrophosphatase [Thermoplasmatales archaeon SCGC AB-539-C06]
MNQKVGAGIGIMLLKDGKVLLGKRNNDPEKADSELQGQGTWTMPGGKLHFGESFEQGAERELTEETEIKANKLKIISLSNDIKGDAHFVTIGLLCEDFQGQAKTMEPDEITEWKWFNLNELPKNIFFRVKRLLTII